MTIENFEFGSIWIDEKLGEECKFIDTATITNGQTIVMLKPIKNMRGYKKIDGLIPFHLESFLDSFEPKTES